MSELVEAAVAVVVEVELLLEELSELEDVLELLLSLEDFGLALP